MAHLTNDIEIADIERGSAVSRDVFCLFPLISGGDSVPRTCSPMTWLLYPSGNFQHAEGYVALAGLIKRQAAAIASFVRRGFDGQRQIRRVSLRQWSQALDEVVRPYLAKESVSRWLPPSWRPLKEPTIVRPREFDRLEALNQAQRQEIATILALLWDDFVKRFDGFTDPERHGLAEYLSDLQSSSERLRSGGALPYDLAPALMRRYISALSGQAVQSEEDGAVTNNDFQLVASLIDLGRTTRAARDNSVAARLKAQQSSQAFSARESPGALPDEPTMPELDPFLRDEVSLTESFSFALSEKRRATDATDEKEATVPKTILRAGFDIAPVTIRELRSGEVGHRRVDSAAPALVAYVHAAGLKQGDMQRVVITGPDGSTFAEHTQPALDRDKSETVVFAGKRKPPDEDWPLGTYVATFTIERDGVFVEKEAFATVIVS